MTPDALLQRTLARSGRLPLFDAQHYRAANPDLAEVDPLWHFARHGVWERRPLIEARRRQARLADGCADALAPQPLATSAAALALRRAPGLQIRLVEPADPAPRTREAAEWLAAALRTVGSEVGDGDPRASPIWIDPVRSPQDPAADPALKARLARGAVVLTGSPAQGGFAEHLPMALLAAGVMAFAPETHAAFAATGMPALWLAPPAVSPPSRPPAAWAPVLPQGAPPRDWAARPYDFAAFGVLTERRIQAWLSMAGPLGSRRGFVHMPRPRAERPAGHDADLRRYVYARARIALHLQPEHAGALPWQTICAGAVRAGAVVVSEPGLAHPLLTPGVHVYEEAPRRMPALVAWLLDTPEGRLEAETRRLAALSALRRADDLFETGLRVASFLTALGEGLR